MKFWCWPGSGSLFKKGWNQWNPFQISHLKSISFFIFSFIFLQKKIQYIFKWKKMCDVFLNKNDWLFFLLFFSPHFWLNLQMKILVPAFNFSYGCKFFTFLDSPSCAPRRLGGDCVFAIALLAPTLRQCSTYCRVRLVLWLIISRVWIGYRILK